MVGLPVAWPVDAVDLRQAGFGWQALLLLHQLLVAATVGRADHSWVRQRLEPWR